MSYIKSINQAVVADSNNSSTTNLASLAFFTGTTSSTLNIVGIQVNLITDQDCTLYVEQSMDGIYWDISDTYNYYTMNGGFSITVQATASYFRVRVKNLGLLTTTYFRLQTALCPIVESVPRSLDFRGNFKTSIQSITDPYNFTVENTPHNEMRVVIPTRLCGSSFIGNVLDNNFWTSGGTNSGTVTQNGGQITLSTSTNSGGTATLTSVRTGRYISGVSNKYRSQIQLSDNGTTNNYRQWGVATDVGMTDGAWYELSGSTFYVVTCYNSTPTKVPSTSWNNNRTVPTFTNITPYEIYYTTSRVYFSIGGLLVHTVNANQSPWTSSTNLKIVNRNVNSGNTSNVTLISRVASIQRLGQMDSTPHYFYQSGANAGQILKNGAGQVHTIFNGDNVGTLMLYDALSTTNPILNFDLSRILGSHVVDIPFFTGLYMVTTGSVLLTIIYE